MGEISENSDFARGLSEMPLSLFWGVGRYYTLNPHEFRGERGVLSNPRVRFWGILDFHLHISSSYAFYPNFPILLPYMDM